MEVNRALIVLVLCRVGVGVGTKLPFRDYFEEGRGGSRRGRKQCCCTKVRS